MLCEQIIEPGFPTLATSDTVADALLVFEDHQLPFLPLIKGTDLLGLISLEVLEAVDERTVLQQVPKKELSVSSGQHIYIALNILSTVGTTVLPVLNGDGQYLGVITQSSLMTGLALMLDVQKAGGAIITLLMNKLDYSLSSLTRLVESADANILQLNTYSTDRAEELWVNIRLDRMEISDVISTLQRYEYHVVHFWGNELYENELRKNFNALMNYLSI